MMKVGRWLDWSGLEGWRGDRSSGALSRGKPHQHTESASSSLLIGLRTRLSLHPIYLAEFYSSNSLCTNPHGAGKIAYPTPSHHRKIRRGIANVLCAILELPIIVTSTAKPCVRR
jgi:hypothetical protein